MPSGPWPPKAQVERGGMGTVRNPPGRAQQPRRGFPDYSLKSLLQFAVLLKIAVIALIYLGYFLFPFNLSNYQANFIYPPGAGPDFWTPLKTWDGQIYLYLAGHGYGPHQLTNAFYPLFPFLVRVAGFLTGGNNFLGGLLVSHLFTLLAMACLYRITRQNYGERAAFYGCLFLLAFPMGFYLGLLYTESLFLLLATGYFYYWGRKGTWPSALCAFLMPLARPTGILVFFPAFIAATEGGQKARPIASRWLPLAGFAAGYAAYFLWMRILTGDAFAAFEAEKHFVSHFAIRNLFHPMDWFLRTFIQIDPTIPFPAILFFNRVFFLFFLWALWVSKDYLTKPLFVYCLVLGIVPALAGGLVTYMRYLLVLFPLFPALARRWKGKEGIYLAGSLALQAYFAVRYALNYFVS